MLIYLWNHHHKRNLSPHQNSGVYESPLGSFNLSWLASGAPRRLWRQTLYAQKLMWVLASKSSIAFMGRGSGVRGSTRPRGLLSLFIALNRGYSIIDGLFIKMVIKSWMREGEVSLTFSPPILAGLLYLPYSIESISQPATIHPMWLGYFVLCPWSVAERVLVTNYNSQA